MFNVILANAGHLRQFGYLLLVSPVMMPKSTKEFEVTEMQPAAVRA